MELIVFSACLKCGETEGWLSWGLWPITSLSALHSNNKQRGFGQRVPSRKCTNCWERHRAAQCTWLQNRFGKLLCGHEIVCIWYPSLSNVFLGVWKDWKKMYVSSWNNNQNGWQQLQSPLYVPGTDPFIPAVVFTCFMEELITICVDSRPVYGHILGPLKSFSKHLNSTTQPYVGARLTRARRLLESWNGPTGYRLWTPEQEVLHEVSESQC